ncbi:unnamed protein product [Prorocentrum cordatum]|uniref:Signal recognition particle receptor subunit beta n=1 Tax=Prorocentrum cordatum TaxID=2364126 RepID=A0ABN9SXF5_9DINO|nr:unnamed protein product [Polarella glacialis]
MASGPGLGLGAVHPLGVYPLGNSLLDPDAGRRRRQGLGRLGRLGDELLLGVLRALPADACARASGASATLRAFAGHEELWRALCLRELARGGRLHWPRACGTWRGAFAASWGGGPREPRAAAARGEAARIYSDTLYRSFFFASVNLDPKWLACSNLERVDAQKISVQDFVARYERQSCPVLLAGAAAGWAAAETWSREQLLQRFGSVDFTCGPCDLPLREFFAYASQNSDDVPLFVFDKRFSSRAPALLEDYQVPEAFRGRDLFDLLPAQARPDFRWLLIGGRRTGSKWHCDPNKTSAWNAVVRGRKRWLLLPPGCPPPGVHPSKDGAEVTQPVSLIEWFTNFYGELRRLADTNPAWDLKEGECGPGDVVFVPCGWWHCVLNLEDALHVLVKLAVADAWLVLEDAYTAGIPYRLELLWRGGSSGDAEDGLAVAAYRPRRYLQRRVPDEIETVLGTIGQEDLAMVQQTFGSQLLDLPGFAECIVTTGTYDRDQVLSFVGGIVDLFLEVARSQARRAAAPTAALSWAQLMNHLIECPEVTNFQGSEATSALAARAQAGERGPEKLPQVFRNAYVDCAKHQGTESVYLWSPHAACEAPKQVTPTLPPDVFGEGSKALWSVLAVAWDPEFQDLVALLSNRIMVVFRLRNREKGQFQQKREFRFHSAREKDDHGLHGPGEGQLDGKQGRLGRPLAPGEGRPLGPGEGRREKAFTWSLYLTAIDPRTGEDIRSRSQASRDRSARKKKVDDEQAMRKQKRDERLAADASTQLDIWFLRPGSFSDKELPPFKVLNEHTRTVTSLMEIGRIKFTTTSLDRTVVLWDNRSLTMEVRIADHERSVLSQAYLSNYASLVTIGCERRVYVWSIDSTTYRGPRAKLSQHQANVLQVSAAQRLFFTIDEACFLIVWDAATLAAVQTVNCRECAPRIVACLPSLGRVCVAGRRLNFYEGNGLAAAFMGVAPTKEQLAKAQSLQEEGSSALRAARPRWCGLSALRGHVLSVTEAEACPARSRPIFLVGEGETISAFVASEELSVAAVGTSSGAIHFLKYRSGFPLKVYPGRREDAAGRREGAEDFAAAAGTAPAAAPAAAPAPAGEPERGVAPALSDDPEDPPELPEEVMDYPGHPRLRGKLVEHLKEARCIIYVVDSENKAQLKDVAEHL